MLLSPSLYGFLVPIFGPNAEGALICFVGSTITSIGLIVEKKAWIAHEEIPALDRDHICSSPSYIFAYVLQFGGMFVNCLAFRVANPGFIGVLSSCLRLIISAGVANLHLNEEIKFLYMPIYMTMLIACYGLLKASPPPKQLTEEQTLALLKAPVIVLSLSVIAIVALLLYYFNESFHPYTPHMLGISSGLLLSIGVIIRGVICKSNFQNKVLLFSVYVPLSFVLIILMVYANISGTLSLKKGNIMLCNVFFEGVVSFMSPLLSILFYQSTLDATSKQQLIICNVGLLLAFGLAFFEDEKPPFNPTKHAHQNFRESFSRSHTFVQGFASII